MEFFSLFLTIILIYSVYSQNIITAKMFDIFGSYITLVSFSTAHQPILFKVMINNNFTIVSEDSLGRIFKINESVFENQTILTISNKKIKATLVNYEFKFYYTNVKISNFPLYLSRNYGYDHLGLAYKFDNISFSLIHYLKNNKLIHKAAFGFIFKNNLNCKLFLGGLPIEEVYLLKKVKCNINKDIQRWGLDLNYIFIGDNKANGIKINKTIYFDFNNAGVNTPVDFISYLNMTFLERYFKEGSCFPTSFFEWNFECKCEIIKTFPSISFVLDKRIFTFSYKELFDQRILNCYFIVMSNIEMNNEWIIGTKMHEKYFPLFDYEEKGIFFYSNESMDFIESKYLTSGFDNRNILLIFNIFQMIFFCFHLCVFSYKQIESIDK